MSKQRKDYSEIIFEDEDVLVVNKAPGLLSVPDRFDPEKRNLRDILQLDQAEPLFIVHRLDRETSGLICFAKNAAAHKELCRQFEFRKVDKTYWALLEGKLLQNEGEITAPIAQHPVKKGLMCVHKKGKPSHTKFKVLEAFKSYTFVEVKLLTGRTHQIRVHFKSIGHPLAIDSDYGFHDAFFLSKIKKRYKTNEKEETALMSRLSLHAQKLSFEHPVSKTKMTFTADMFKDFRAVLNQLKKWNSL